jgi:hypothetical protein
MSVTAASRCLGISRQALHQQIAAGVDFGAHVVSGTLVLLQDRKVHIVAAERYGQPHTHQFEDAKIGDRCYYLWCPLSTRELAKVKRKQELSPAQEKLTRAWVALGKPRNGTVHIRKDHYESVNLEWHT